MGFQVDVFADFAQIYQWASQKEQNVEKIRPKPKRWLSQLAKLGVSLSAWYYF